MKKLQNDFTTPEQSKRLFELGVPADSANCFIDLRTGTIYHCQDKTYSEIVNNYDELGLKRDEFSSCWSAGRLMEIWDICGNGAESVSANVGTSRVELLVKLYEENAEYADFSKLED